MTRCTSIFPFAFSAAGTALRVVANDVVLLGSILTKSPTAHDASGVAKFAYTYVADREWHHGSACNENNRVHNGARIYDHGEQVRNKIDAKYWPILLRQYRYIDSSLLLLDKRMSKAITLLCIRKHYTSITVM